MRALAFLLVLLAPLAAQETSEAERLYKDAWWQETGASDYEKALVIYAQAADAAGPDRVRAQALLRLAEVHKRLGDTEPAIKALQRLTSSFAGEQEAVATARSRLAEWTAVDVRESYPDWYRRHLFSPEYQAKIVELVHRLGSRTGHREAWDQVAALGDAAAPALREAVKSSNPRLVESASLLLLQLGDLPPVEALLRHDEWRGDPDAWLGILGAPAAERARFRGAIRDTGPLTRLLKAAATSSEAVLALARTETGGALALDSADELLAVLSAMLASNDADVHRAITDLAVASDTPFRVRGVAASLVMSQDPLLGMDAAAWLAWARRVYDWIYKLGAVKACAARLRPGDAETLDGLIAYVESMDPELAGDLLSAIAGGLNENGVPVQLPWTAARLRTVMMLACRYEQEDVIAALGVLRLEADPGERVLDSILEEPAAWRPLLDDTGLDLMRCLRDRADPDSPEGVLVEARWGRAVLERLAGRWEAWTPEQRGDAIRIVKDHAVIHEDRPPPGLGAFLKKHMAQVADPELRVSLEAWLERLEQ